MVCRLDTSTIGTALAYADGTVWLVQDGTLFSVDPRHRLCQPVTIPGLGDAMVLALCARGDSLWMSTQQDEIILVRKGIILGRWRSPGRHVAQVSTDAEGNLWCATDDGLVHLRVDGGIVRQPVLYGQQNGFPPQPMICVLVDREECIWIGTWTRGLVKFVEHHIQTFPLDPGVVNVAIGAAYHDSRGHIWASSEHGLWELWKHSKSGWRLDHHDLPGMRTPRWRNCALLTTGIGSGSKPPSGTASRALR